MENNKNIEKRVDIKTEIVDLPSKGLLYSKDNILSKGVVEMRYMTAADEDVMLSKNLLKKGKAIETLIKRLVVTDIEWDSILIGDKNAIIFSARLMGYGPDYRYGARCPECDARVPQDVDISKLKYTEIDEKLAENGNKFKFKLPYSGDVIEFKNLVNTDSENIEAEMKRAKLISGKEGDNLFIDPIITSRLFYSILSINGNDNKAEIRNYVNNMRVGDSRALRTEMDKVKPDVDYTIPFSCTECDYEGFVEIIPDAEFFWPST